MSDVKKDKETDKVIREHAVLFRLITREGFGGNTEADEVDEPQEATSSAEAETGAGDAWSVRETVKPGLELNVRKRSRGKNLTEGGL